MKQIHLYASAELKPESASGFVDYSAQAFCLQAPMQNSSGVGLWKTAEMSRGWGRKLCPVLRGEPQNRPGQNLKIVSPLSGTLAGAALKKHGPAGVPRKAPHPPFECGSGSCLPRAADLDVALKPSQQSMVQVSQPTCEVGDEPRAQGD